MTKILVSDLIGTLIPTDENELEYLYGRGRKFHYIGQLHNDDKDYYHFLMDKMFILLARWLREFLEEGNYLNIVTAINSHTSPDFMFCELLGRLYNNMADYRDQISLFMVGSKNDLRDLSTVAPITYKNGVTYAGNLDGQFITFFKDKVETLNFIYERQNVEDASLYAIGDSESDIPMLFRCIDLGGQSALIAHYLYTCWQNEKLDTDEILHLTASSKANMKREKELSQLYPNLDMMDEEAYQEIYFQYDKEIWTPYYSSEKEKLYTMLHEGKINLLELMKRQQVYDVLRDYNDANSIGFFKKEPIDMERMNELSIYPTFSDFCNKVLTK